MFMWFSKFIIHWFRQSQLFCFVERQKMTGDIPVIYKDDVISEKGQRAFLATEFSLMFCLKRLKPLIYQME